MTDSIASTPQPPYFAVVFTSLRTDEDDVGYQAMASRMLELAAQQAGYLGVESVRGSDGLGMTVSYWQDLDSTMERGRGTPGGSVSGADQVVSILSAAYLSR